HVRVGNCQTSNQWESHPSGGFFAFGARHTVILLPPLSPLTPLMALSRQSCASELHIGSKYIE
ncbi:hypothetical protein QP597_16935, partial [Providencia stuartii]|nr:hypothetical protein [Providencia stuartii]